MCAYVALALFTNLLDLLTYLIIYIYAGLSATAGALDSALSAKGASGLPARPATTCLGPTLVAAAAAAAAAS